MTQLNLGSGILHKQGFINIDIVPPYLDGTVDRVEADNLLEHLDNEQFIFVMNEVHRVLKPGGMFWFCVPNALDWMDGAFGDFTHKRFFVPRSFYYFTETPTYENYGKSYGIKCFKQISLENDGKFFKWTGIPLK